MVSSVILALAVGFVLTQVANVATTVYLHRTLAHSALTVSKPLTWVFRVTIWLLTGIRPRQWAAVHRKHHAFTDEPQDPHSPAQLGWVHVQLRNVFLYRRVARDDAQVAKYARDLPQTTADRLLLDHALLGLGITTAVLVWWLGAFGVLAAVFHFLLYLSLSAAVNAVAHTFGDRPYANSATNLQWLAWLTCGEGFHNNHHAAPTSARFALDPGQIDPGWWVISAASAAGAAKVRHDEPKFATPGRDPSDREEP